MKVKVLGCYGGELPGYRTTCFLINDHILLDAGAVTSVLSLKSQMKIDSIFITHSHIDHIKDILFLADNVCGWNSRTIRLYSTSKNIRMIRRHLLNNAIWPDFSMIPSKHKPVLELVTIREGEAVRLKDVHVKPVKVRHAIETMGYIISGKKSSIIFSSDTGPTDRLWRTANSVKNLKAVFIETSYPDTMEDIAKLSGHLTPSMLLSEIKKLKESNVRILIYHMKPFYLKKIASELKRLRIKNIHIIRQGEILNL